MGRAGREREQSTGVEWEQVSLPSSRGGGGELGGEGSRRLTQLGWSMGAG